MRTPHRLALVVAQLIIASGCNLTLHRIDFPSSTVWNQVLTGFASPYNDLSLVTTGTGTTAMLVPGFLGDGGTTVLGYCTIPPSDSTIVACTNNDPSSCAADCTTQGGALSGIRYSYSLVVLLDRPAFQSGGVQVVSAAKGVQYSLTLAVNTTSNQVNLVGNISDGVLPLSSKSLGTLSATIDSYAEASFSPHDPNFVDTAYPSGAATPTFACTTQYGADTVLVDTTKPMSASYTCGSLVLNVNLGQPLDLKKDVLARLRALAALVTNRTDKQRLAAAVSDLAPSVSARLWLDASRPAASNCRGSIVFQKEAATVVDLRERITSRTTTLDRTQLQGFVDELVRADQLIAQTAISDATAHHDRQHRLTRAMQRLHAGDMATSAGQAAAAIEAYRESWSLLTPDCADSGY